MLTETTASKQREMQLSIIANTLKDPPAHSQFQNMAFEERIGLLIDVEWNQEVIDSVYLKLHRVPNSTRCFVYIGLGFTPALSDYDYIPAPGSYAEMNKRQDPRTGSCRNLFGLGNY